MITKIKRYLFLVSSMIMMATPMAFPIAAHAAAGSCGNIGNVVADGASSATPGSGAGGTIDCTGSNTDATSSIAKLAKSAVNIFSFIVGAIAVIMIIYGGFRYITSGGDSNSVGSAKNTLIYAIVGLVIVALAQILVQFVLNQTADAVVK